MFGNDFKIEFDRYCKIENDENYTVGSAAIGMYQLGLQDDADYFQISTGTSTGMSFDWNINNSGDASENIILHDIDYNAQGTGTHTFETINVDGIDVFKRYMNGDYVIAGDITQKVWSGAMTDGSPTDTEIDTITSSTPAGVGSGWTAVMLDSDGAGGVYRVISDGTSWYYIELEKAN